jgi:hypothetical protein
MRARLEVPVAIAGCHVTVDLAALPWALPSLRIRFDLGTADKSKPVLLIYPGASPAAGPPQVRYACGLILNLDDGTQARSIGQLVITGQRIIGMITGGNAGAERLDSSTGSVYAFSVGLDDIQPVETRPDVRGRPVEAVIRSVTGQQPGFALQVFSVAGSLDDHGKLTYRSMSDLLQWLTPEGREKLRQAP